LSQREEARMTVQPLTGELSRLHITVSRRFLAKLEMARMALSHAVPRASDEDLLEAGLDLILAQDAKKKGLVAKPRHEPRPSKTDRIPAHVRRAVWTRDGGRCQWPLDSGGICGCAQRLELAHRVPRARGGPPTVDNLRLLCAFHNQHEARLDFGELFMSQFSNGTPSARGSEVQDSRVETS
jgi:hypothetical protein